MCQLFHSVFPTQHSYSEQSLNHHITLGVQRYQLSRLCKQHIPIVHSKINSFWLEIGIVPDPFPQKPSGYARLSIFRDIICPVAMARCAIRSSPHTRTCNKLQLLDLSLGFTTVSYYSCLNSQKWATTTTCDVVYPMFNAHQLKYNDIIGNLGTCHRQGENRSVPHY